MRVIGYMLLFILVCCGLFGFGVKLGFGSRDEPIGSYQVRVPIGWNVLTNRDINGLDSSTIIEKLKWFTAISLLGGMLEIKILTPEDIKTEADNYRRRFKRERGFPEVMPGMHATATQTSNAMINDIPFQKVDWSCRITDLIPPQSRSMIRGPFPNFPVIWGFEYQSIPINNKEIIRCECKSINEASLRSAERIVLSLKQRKL